MIVWMLPNEIYYDLLLLDNSSLKRYRTRGWIIWACEIIRITWLHFSSLCWVVHHHSRIFLHWKNRAFVRNCLHVVFIRMGRLKQTSLQIDIKHEFKIVRTLLNSKLYLFVDIKEYLTGNFKSNFFPVVSISSGW